MKTSVALYIFISNIHLLNATQMPLAGSLHLYSGLGRHKQESLAAALLAGLVQIEQADFVRALHVEAECCQFQHGWYRLQREVMLPC